MTQQGWKNDVNTGLAKQPVQPSKECEPLPEEKLPVLVPPVECPKPPESCGCPTPSDAQPDCFENLIEEQAKQITVADKAKVFKAELEAIAAKAKAASLEYNANKYSQLLKIWQGQDREIAELIRKLVCAVPCWRCVIECYVCPLLNALHESEQRLYREPDKAAPPDSAINLYELRSLLERIKDKRQRQFIRVGNVLRAWEKPAQTIEKNLADNAKLIEASGKTLGTDASKVVYDVFLKLVPMHLAIAPPALQPETTTKIDVAFTDFCKCDIGVADTCCGPDVGPMSLRQRLIGPQPYLVEPSMLQKIICCLAQTRYVPAMQAAADAEAQFQVTEAEIKRRMLHIEKGLQTFESDAKAVIPSVVTCCDEALDADSVESQTR